MATIKELKAQIEHLEEQLSLLRFQSTPVGAVCAFATDRRLTGWLICNGQEYRIDDYKELYDSIGHVFDKENTPEGFFCVPDLQGKFIRGWDMSGGIDKDREFGSLQEDALQEHGHKVWCSSSGSHKHMVGTDQWDRTYGGFGSSKYTHKDIKDYSSTTTNYNTNETGSHSHYIIVEQPESINKQIIYVATETRPKNVALLYCIKAK